MLTESVPMWTVDFGATDHVARDRTCKTREIPIFGIRAKS